MKKRVSKKEAGIKARRQEMMREAMVMDPQREARLAAIQMLIPVGLSAVSAALQEEWRSLVGERYARGKEMGPWGSNEGSVYVYDQKVRVKVPRVRRKDTLKEVPLMNYARLQQPWMIEDVALRRIMGGISQRNYEEAALTVPETLGIKRTAVGARWIRASSRALAAYESRDLSVHDVVAMIIDGKAFGDNEMIIAIGVTLEGKKVLLGFIEASTERFEVCRDFLNGLIERGLRTDNEILVILDGGKGLWKGVETVLGEKAVMGRCHWHKQENVVSYLNPGSRDEWRRKLGAAYRQPSYEKARGRLLDLKRELKPLNVSAYRSLEEGMEETLTLHRLGLFEELGKSFKTTNMIENVNRLLEDKTGRVCRWHNSDQRRRWVATALLKIEPRLRRLKGYKHLPALREAMRQLRAGHSEQIKQAA